MNRWNLALILALLAGPSHGALLFVDADATGAGSGDSWADAFTELQPALDAAADGDEVWVACATYLPTELRDPLDPRSASFVVRTGVSVFGGFAGGEEALEQRHPDPVDNGCALGIAATDKGGAAQPYSLVVVDGVDQQVRFDGFSVVGALADGPSDAERVGAGFRVVRSDVVLRNMRLHDLATIGNGPGQGGGVFADRSTVDLEDVDFSECTSGRGAAVTMVAGQLLARRVSVKGCSTGFSGGGFLILRSGASAEVVDGLFEDNVANNGGGAIANESTGPLTIRRSVFRGNQVVGQRVGGALHMGGGVAVIENSVFVGNFTEGSSGRGGAISLFGTARATITNTTIGHNQAGVAGSGIFVDTNASVLVQNSVVHGNLLTNAPGPEAHQVAAGGDLGAAVVAFSLVEGGFAGEGNLDADPEFVLAPSPGDGDWQTVEDNDFGDVRLSFLSPAIDAGDNEADVDGDGDGSVVAADLELDAGGQPRVADMPTVPDTGAGGPPVIDMGALEASEAVFDDGFELSARSVPSRRMQRRQS